MILTGIRVAFLGLPALHVIVTTPLLISQTALHQLWVSPGLARSFGDSIDGAFCSLFSFLHLLSRGCVSLTCEKEANEEVINHHILWCCVCAWNHLLRALSRFSSDAVRAGSPTDASGFDHATSSSRPEANNGFRTSSSSFDANERSDLSTPP